MKILFVSFFFPPFNTIGAVRTGKTSKYFVSLGHKVRILTADNQALPACLPLELPESIVARTGWLHLGSQIKQWLIKRKTLKKSDKTDGQVGKIKEINIFVLLLKKIYKSIFRFPDPQIGWFPYAIFEGRMILRDWKPDIIFASSMPYTSLLIANRLSKEFHIPWVAEFRDLWVDNHYREYGPLRNWIDSKIEKRTLQSASGLVTVSEPAAEVLRSKYPQPCVVITNGFDPDDFDSKAKPSNEGSLKIVYTGSLYRGKRDPSNLFKAIESIGKEKEYVKVHFYGPNLDLVGDLARKYRCEANVEISDPIPYLESLKAQQQADILLLLLWNDPKEIGVFTGKLFEYLGARRPILAIGPSGNVASQTIMERNAGVVANDSETIAEHLKQWIKTKQRGVPIASPPEEAIRGFSRQEQAGKLAKFLEEIILKSRECRSRQ